MSDLLRNPRRGRADADNELAVRRLRKSITDSATTAAAYTPADASNWASPAPTTIAEALDRLAAASPGA